MKKIVGFIIMVFAAVPLSAQQITLDVPGLADRAKEVVDVTLDGPLLRVAAKFLSNNDPDERAAREIASRLKGIYVRSYSFDKEGEYDYAIVEKLRTQLSSWKRVVTVRDRFRENNEVYVNLQGDDVIGLAIIAAEPKELTIVNIVGPIDIEKLASIEGEFGIPRIRMMKRGRHD